MINIDPVLKTIYKNDRFPMSTEAHPKDMEANFPALSLIIVGDQFADDKGEFELSEGICRDNDLKFGKCNSAQVKFTVADVVDEIAGKEFYLKQTVDDTYEMPYGYFTVDTCPKQDDLRFKDITAYDRMKRIDTDVAAWYNSLTFPMTLAAFRASFLAYVNLEEDTGNLPLPNDSMIITKTIEPATLLGRDVIEKLEEINGVFGRIGRDGKFKHVALAPGYGLYPGTFYPGQEYPRSEYDNSYVAQGTLAETIDTGMTEQVRFEEYTVKEITKLIVRSDAEDIGAIVTADKGPLLEIKTGTAINSTKTDDGGTAEIIGVKGTYRQTVTVQGKNLLGLKNGTYSASGITAIVENGLITVNGTAVATAFVVIPFSYKVNDTNTLSLNNATLASGTLVRFETSSEAIVTTQAPLNVTNSKVTFTLSDTQISKLVIRVGAGTTVDFAFKPQLELGSTATAYEPFVPNSPSPDYPSPVIVPHDFNITASGAGGSNLAAITGELAALPNGVRDEIVRGADGKLRRIQRIGKVVFDGSTDENWIYNNSSTTIVSFYVYIPDMITPLSGSAINALCNNFNVITANSYSISTSGESCFPNRSSRIHQVQILKSRLIGYADGLTNGQKVALFKTWLSANVSTLYYPLATPTETAIDDITLSTYNGSTSISTNADPQVEIAAEFYGNTNNAYIIEGNFLLYGKGAEELQQIARNAFGYMAKRPYRPFESSNIGLPYLEPGDLIKFDQNDPVVGYIFNRTLSGIQALRDNYAASGNKERENNTSVNTKIAILDRKATRIKMDVEGVRVEVEDLAASTSAQFEIAFDDIGLKVNANGVIAAINISPETVKIQAPKIAFEGMVTANEYFKIHLDGSMEAVNGKFSGELVAATGVFYGNLNAAGGTFSGNLAAAGGTFTGTLSGVDGTFTGTLDGNIIIGAEMNGGIITGAKIVSQSGGNATTIENGTIATTLITMASGNLSSSYAAGGAGYSDSSGNFVTISTDRINVGKNGVANARILADGEGNFKYLYCNYLNGFAPITSENIGEQSVRALRETVYVSAENNFRPYSTAVYSCGTTNGKWSSVWAANGTIQTSDERKKTDIQSLEEDDRFLMFAKMIMPYTYRMISGTSGRRHVGFIAQRIEEAMAECNISDMEFAGLIKAPVYAKMLIDEDGNQTDDYDMESEIIDYDYNLRYDEFIPLIFLWIRSLENR